MSIRKHGDGWQVRVPPFPAKTVPRKKDAERLEIDLKTQKALGHLHKAEPILFGRALDDLLELKKAVGGKRGKLRPKTVTYYVKSIKPWEPLRDVLVSSLRRKRVEDHIIRRAKKAPVAARNELQIAKAALRLAESRGQFIDRAIFDIAPVYHEPIEGRALEPDEIMALAAWMPDMLKRAVLLTGTVGFRLAEVREMTEDMLDLEKGEVVIPRWLNKSRRKKVVPLAASEVALFREQLALPGRNGSRIVFPTGSGGAYSESGFRKQWQPARKAAGMADFKFHWLRHTAGSLMAKAGMDPTAAAKRLGHTDGGALFLKTYRHLYEAEIARAVALMDGALAGGEKK